MTSNLCRRTNVPLLCPCYHLFRKQIFLEDLFPPFPPSQNKGILPLCDLLTVTHLTVSGRVLVGTKTTIILGSTKVVSSHSPFIAEVAAQPSLLQLWKLSQKYSDVHNGAACSACGATTRAYCKSMSHSCKLLLCSAKCK